jgi:hypothetical protein
VSGPRDDRQDDLFGPRLKEIIKLRHRWSAWRRIETKDIERVVVDNTVQGKAVAHPSDARPIHRAIEKLVDLAKRERIELRQSYLRLAKRAAIKVGRYAHAHQFKRARRELTFLRTGSAVSSGTSPPVSLRSRQPIRKTNVLAFLHRGCFVQSFPGLVEPLLIINS